MGFFVVTTAYSVLKRFIPGAWLGGQRSPNALKHFYPSMFLQYCQNIGFGRCSHFISHHAKLLADSIRERKIAVCPGTLMPAMLSLYELGCPLLVQRAFTKEFVEEGAVLMN